MKGNTAISDFTLLQSRSSQVKIYLCLKIQQHRDTDVSGTIAHSLYRKKRFEIISFKLKIITLLNYRSLSTYIFVSVTHFVS